MSNKDSSLLMPQSQSLPPQWVVSMSPSINNPSGLSRPEEEDEVNDDLASLWIDFGGDG